MQEELIQSLIDEVEGFDETLLLAGLGVLVKDLNEYLSDNPRDDADVFEGVVSETIEEIKSSFGHDSPFFVSPKETNLPDELAKAAAGGHPTVTQLGNPAIIHEWTVGPGKRFFEKFAVKFKDTICGKDGPHEQFNKGLLGQAELPTTIVSAILAAGFSVATFWYPLAVYVGLLIVKAGLKTYCES